MSKMNGGKDHKFTVEPSRRTLLKSALALVVGAVVAPMAATSVAATDTSAASTGTGLPLETEPKPSLDPHKNPSWEGWDNPRLGRTNGWGTSETQAWTTILNPQDLPIYHDRFYRIPESNRKHHWVMVMDTRKCVGCQACVVSCKSENNIPLGVYRTWVDVYQTGDTVPDPEGDITLDDGQRYRMDARVVNMPKICNHCAHPPCVEVCPVKATFKRQDGIVMVDPRLCIGCGTCVNACPYDARYINPISHVADKCTFCVERTDAGLLPACVTSCVGRARVFGDILDPNSEVSRLLAHYPHSVRHPEFGTDPQVFYIGESGDISTDPDPNVQHMVFSYTSNANSNVPDTVDVI